MPSLGFTFCGLCCEVCELCHHNSLLPIGQLDLIAYLLNQLTFCKREHLGTGQWRARPSTFAANFLVTKANVRCGELNRVGRVLLFQWTCREA